MSLETEKKNLVVQIEAHVQDERIWSNIASDLIDGSRVHGQARRTAALLRVRILYYRERLRELQETE